MRVTMAMVLDGLRERYACHTGAYYEPNYPIDRVCIYETSRAYAFESAVCYLTKYEEHYVAAGALLSSVVMIGGEFEVPVVCAVSIQAPCTLHDLREAVAAIVARYENWSDSLLDLSLHGAGLEELVDYAHRLFRNPITVVDENYQLLAQTLDDEMDDDLWLSPNALELDVRAALQPTSDFEEEGFKRYLSDLKDGGVLRNYETSAGSRMTSCVAGKLDNRMVGLNVVHKSHEVTEGETQCLQHFASIIRAKLRAMEFTWQDSSGSYVALLHDVVRGNLPDASEFKARLNDKWIVLEEKFTVFAVTSRTGFLRYYQLCRIEDDLNRLIPDGKTVINLRKLIVFLNHDEQLEEDTLARLCTYAAENKLAIGVSESRGHDYSLAELLEQAYFALRVRKRLPKRGPLYFFADCRRYCLFDLCGKTGHWSRFMHPCVEAVGQYDQDAALPLTPTLECLVRNSGNRTATAKELGIQRNTLQYRIGKIEEICSIDLSDADTFDHVAFSIRLREYWEEEN